MFFPRPLTAIVACFVSFAASPAMAQYSHIWDYSSGFEPNAGGYLTSKLQMVMYSDVSGANIVDQYDCAALVNCAPGRNGAFGSYRVTLVQPTDPAEDIYASYCESDPDTTSFTCFNSPLWVSTRYKTGNLSIRMIGADAGKPHIQTGAQLRFQIRDTDYFWQTARSGHDEFPIGSWTPTLHVAPVGHCRPQPVNSAPVFVVEEGDENPTYDWEFYGTICDMYVESFEGGGTIIDLNSDWSCVMPAGQYTKCEFEVPYGEVARFQAVGDSAHVGEMRRTGGPCAYSEGDSTTCVWTPKENRDIKVDWLPVSSSATLVASAGSSSPESRDALAGATDVAVQQVHLVGTGTAAVNQVQVTMTGTGSINDILGVKVYVDANGNGVVDEGETLAGEGSMSASTSAILLDATAVGSGLDLLVAVDYSATIQAAMTLPGAPWTLLLVLGWALAIMLRRRAPGVSVALCALAIATSLACGGGGSNNEDTSRPSDSDNNSDTDDGDNDDTDEDGDGDVDPSGAKTYSFSITGISGTESVSGGPAVIATGLPLVGATISVLP